MSVLLSLVACFCCIFFIVLLSSCPVRAIFQRGIPRRPPSVPHLYSSHTLANTPTFDS
ncbi:hypothetical protein BJX99DRAFT_233643 [Aspergillus californicus]